MKISKSKQELARIISENGGWRDGVEFFASTCNGIVIGSKSKPKYTSKYGWVAAGGFIDDRIELHSYLKNWHQTILSRAEYSHLYPAREADGWIEWSGGECPVDKDARIDIRMTGGTTHYDTDTHWGWNADSFKITHYRLHKPEQSNPEFCESMMGSIPEPTAKPTIEQLAADYRSAKDYAERKQQEADDAKADANEALRKLEIAGEAIGLLLSPINAKKEPELVIAVQVGDEVECIKSNVNPGKYMGMVGRLRTIDESDTSTPYLVDFGGEANIWCHEVKFIRRP